MRHGIIFKATNGTTRFITPSGRMYIWAYGAWRFHYQFVDSTYKLLRSAVGKPGSKVFLASSRKLFMEKRVALDPIDYLAIECIGRRFSKGRLLRKSEIAMAHQNASVAYGKNTRKHLMTGYQPCITPTPFYSHKIRPPKNR